MGPSSARHSKQTKYGAHQVQQRSKHLSTKSSAEPEEQNIRNRGQYFYAARPEDQIKKKKRNTVLFKMATTVMGGVLMYLYIWEINICKYFQ